MRRSILFLMIIVFFSSILLAQTNPELINTVEDLKNRYLTDPVRDRNILLVITIIIFSFGALITTIQAINSKKAKIITQLLGLIIAIAVGVQTQLYDADYKTYRRTCVEIETRIDEFYDQYEFMDLANSQIKSRYIIDLIGLKEKCKKSLNILYPKNQENVAKMRVSPGVLYAQELITKQIPDWYNPRSEANKSYMLAQQSSPILDEAYKTVLKSSMQQFVDTLRITIMRSLKYYNQTAKPEDIKKIVENISLLVGMRWEQNLTNDWFTFNIQDSSFTYYVRIKIEPSILKEIFFGSVSDLLSPEVRDYAWRDIEGRYSSSKIKESRKSK